MKPRRPLSGRTALVTGGSRGIGAAGARTLAAMGATVIATHRLVTAVAPGMLTQGYGRMILIGSLHAEGPSAPAMTANGGSTPPPVACEVTAKP